MNPTLNSKRRLVRSLAKLLLYMIMFALPMLTAVNLAQAGAQPPQVEPPPAFDLPLPAPPAHDSTRLTAVILAGNTGTETSDLLAPYEVLSASGAFNVYVVAPERRPSPLFPADLDILPHFSFAEYDRIFGTDPDLIVVPQINTKAADAVVLDWLRAHAGEKTTVLSICAGAVVVADAGLLAGRQAATHYTVLPFVKQSNPDVRWVSGLRYVEDGQFISSAGVTSGVDATLYTIQRLVGREVALEAARRVGYPHTHYLDDRTWSVHDVSFAPLLPYALRSDRTEIGLVLYDGLREIEVGSVADTYPYAYGKVLTVAPERRVVRSRYGLDMIPRYELSAVGALDRVLIPGRPDAAVLATIEPWASSHGLIAEVIHADGGYPYDLTLSDIARQETRPIAASVARDLEYPVDHLRLEGNQWPLGLLMRGLALIVLGVALALGVKRASRWLKLRLHSVNWWQRPSAT